MAFPDRGAGIDYYVVAYSPPYYGSEYGIANCNDGPAQITITYTGRATPDIADTTFTLQAGENLQIQVGGAYIFFHLVSHTCQYVGINERHCLSLSFLVSLLSLANVRLR